jgi:uncharacterized protein YrrD
MNMQKHMELLGMKVRDQVTGYTGVVSSVSFDLYGCIQAIVTPKAGEAGKQEDSRWFDVQRLRVIGKKPVMVRPNYEYGYVAEGRKGSAEKPAGRW